MCNARENISMMLLNRKLKVQVSRPYEVSKETTEKLLETLEIVEIL